LVEVVVVVVEGRWRPWYWWECEQGGGWGGGRGGNLLIVIFVVDSAPSFCIISIKQLIQFIAVILLDQAAAILIVSNMLLVFVPLQRDLPDCTKAEPNDSHMHHQFFSCSML
jgi:hypothetical protein